MRVRIRRFSSVELERRPTTVEDRAHRSKQSEVRTAKPGCWPDARDHADCQRFEPHVPLAQLSNRTLLRFHCFQITDRNLRRIHASSFCSTEGVWLKPK